MIDGDVDNGDIVEYKNNSYVVTATENILVRFEDGWRDAIEYRREDRSVPYRFVRRKTDFLEKFTLADANHD